MHVKKMKLLSPLVTIVKSLSHFILQECICFLFCDIPLPIPAKLEVLVPCFDFVCLGIQLLI
jgi:hypothetical protein